MPAGAAVSCRNAGLVEPFGDRAERRSLTALRHDQAHNVVGQLARTPEPDAGRALRRKSLARSLTDQPALELGELLTDVVNG